MPDGVAHIGKGEIIGFGQGQGGSHFMTSELPPPERSKTGEQHQRIPAAESNAPDLLGCQPVAAHEGNEFSRFDEFLPYMDVWMRGADEAPVLPDFDEEELAQPGSVHRVIKENATRFQRASDFADHEGEVVNMLQHIAAGHDVEGAVGKRQGLPRPTR